MTRTPGRSGPPAAALALVLLAAPAGSAAPMLAAPKPPLRLDLRASTPAPPRLLQGRLPGVPLTGPSSDEPSAIARSFVAERLAPPGELALLEDHAGGGGVRFVTLEQRFEGLPVAGGRITVALDEKGRVLAARAGELAPAPPLPRTPAPALEDDEAAWKAALRLLPPAAQETARLLLCERTWQPTGEGAVAAWRLRLLPDSDPLNGLELVLRERDGRLLRREGTGFGAVRARVFPLDPDRGSVLVDFPDPVDAPSVDSPAGWAPLGFTVGNNVEAHLERGTLLSEAGPVALATGEPPSFDFPFTGDPLSDVDAALTNVFWAFNEAHDRFRRLGFDEPSGALQQDGFGRGGADGDPLHALVQYASEDGTEPYGAIASAIGADGRPSYVVVGLFETATGEIRDGSFETDLLFHEYGHAVSIRLMGGEPLCLGGPQPAAILEGWSDFFAASFTKDPVIGAWTSGNSVSGQRSAALDRNSLSLVNLCAGGCNAFRDGEIWSGALWELREELIALHGEDEGARLAEELAFEALRYTPCRATFLDARDALLIADAALHGGVHHCLAWSVFAGRGLGASATTAGPDDQLPEPGFDLPPQCSGGAALVFDLPEYGSTAEARLELVDGTGSAEGSLVLLSSSTGDAEAVSLTALPGGPLLAATIALEPGPPVPDDGVLQVADGATIDALHPPTGAAAQALVSESAALVLVRHLIDGSACQAQGDDDHADAPDWDLPGFLDAGESADLLVVAANITPAPLVDASVTVSCDHPGVTVLPAGPIPLGTIPAQDRGFGRGFAVPLHVSADRGVLAGEVANLSFQLTATGRSGSFVLQLPLNLDYVVETAVSPFRGGVETFERDSWSVLGWSHEAKRPGADDWKLTQCEASSGLFSFGNVLDDCSSYSEDQAAALLLSPPLFAALPPDAQAWRFRDIGWRQKVDLYTDPIVAFCDADLVGAFFTTDADTLPYDDPTGIFSYGPLRAWWFVDNDPDWQAGGTYGYDTATRAIFPELEQLRLAFVFWNEIFDIDDCGFETPNQGSFYLDDVRFAYDLLRVVPEATPCDSSCTLDLVLEASPPGGHCAGTAFELDASATTILDCAGELLFTYEGPGVPAGYELTTEDRAPAVAEDGGVWTVTAVCDTEPDCRAVRTLLSAPPQLPGLGGPHPESLRLRHEGGDLVLDWQGAALPATYGVFAATQRDELEDGVAAWPLRLSVDGEGPRGEGQAVLSGAAAEPGLEYYRVQARDPCTGRPR